MDLNSAYSKLGLSTTASSDEVKKAFRDLSKKYHPDKNKEPDAVNKYKEITEAYNFINNPSVHDKAKQNPFNNNDFSGFSQPFNINFDFFDFGGREHSKMRNANPIIKEVSISFEESILGKSINLKIDRKKGCDDCLGQGSKTINNGCKDCKGMGRTIQQQQNFISVVECRTCKGKNITQECKTCSSQGEYDLSSEYDIKIPGGVVNDNILKMQNAGNFIGNMHGMMLHSDVLIKIKVANKPGFKLEDGLVKTSLDVSLLDALKGTKLNVETVLGLKEIKINPKTKNNEKIIINSVGVNKVGNQEVTINVTYPENTEKLIEFLTNGH